MEYKVKLIKNKPTSLLKQSWICRLGYKDARKNINRLLLYASAVIIGISAEFSLTSFNNNLLKTIDIQARELLGADVSLNSKKRFEEEVITKLDSIKSTKALRVDLPSMVNFMTSSSGVRLVRVVALNKSFPFYGNLVTYPKNADKIMKNEPAVLIDSNLIEQYEISGDDSVSIGNMTFKVAGEMIKFPGNTISSSFTPSVYISMNYLDSTDLVHFGSKIDYKYFFKTKNERETQQLLNELTPLSKKYGYSLETVQSKKEDLGDSFKNVLKFLNILAFIALILGCLGIASSVHIYVSEKKESVAMLRCIGSSGWDAFYVYFIQAIIIGFIGTLMGLLLGLGIQYFLPMLFNGILPVDFNFEISWIALFEGMVLGIIITILFSTLPLLSIRQVPALSILREPFFNKLNKFSKAKTAIISTIILFPLVFAIYQTNDIIIGLSFFISIVVAAILLSFLGGSIMILSKKYISSSLPFVWKQSLANLFRPNNQTIMLVVVIGLGTFLISTLNILQNSVLNQMEFIGNENKSNTILFDIQPSQKEKVIQLTDDNNLKVNQLVPIITCRIEKINNKTVTMLQNDTTDNIPNWALTREYRVTYRDSIHSSETLISGSLQHTSNDSIFITVSKRMRENLDLNIGDSILFDVQGKPIKTYLSGIREVDWIVDPPNFIFIFPNQVLENAPQTFVLTTRINEMSTSNQYQKQLVALFPNISFIDITLIMQTIDDFFDKTSFIIQFMSLLSIVAGLFVLSGAVINNKFVRMKENLLLNTLGTKKIDITIINILEHGYLGFFSSLSGIILSLLASWILTKFIFNINFYSNPINLGIILFSVISLTIIIGAIVPLKKE